MEPRRRKLLARLVLGAAVAGCMTWLARLDYAKHISTDVLELMPADERDPALMLVRQMASQQQARVALFVLEIPETIAPVDEPLARATEAFTATLRQSPAFAEVVALTDPAVRDEIGGFVFARRFELSLPGWLSARQTEHATQAEASPFDAWLAERTAADLETFLARPEALGFAQALPADPLLLVPGLVESVRGLEGGDLAASRTDQGLVWARLAASPLTEAGQQPVFAAVEEASAAARAIAPGVGLRWTGVSRFAAESRRRIDAEMSVLNALALIAVLTIEALCLRRLRQMLHLAPGILCSLLGAWTVTTLVFDRVHILVLVIGSLLAGIAADYGLHIYLHQGSPDEDWAARMRAVRRPLIGSAVTAMIGFSALLLSDLPLLRQVGVFVVAGLVAAIGSALLWFAQVRRPQGELRPPAQRVFASAGRHLQRARGPALIVGGLVIAGGLGRVHWRDDIRDLDVRVPALWENDRAVRTQFGQTMERDLFLARGDDPATARAALENFRAWMRRENPAATLASVGSALPSPAELQTLPSQLARLSGFEGELRAALERHGFDAAEFAPFFSAWEDARKRRDWPTFESLVHDFSAALRGPAGMLFATDAGASWFAVAVDGPMPRVPPRDVSVVSASQLESLNELVAGYRRSALHLSLVGLVAGAISVLLIYGLRQGPRMILVPVGACLCTFGVLGLAGQTLNLFHLLGAFLALCLSLDYAIFTGDRAARGEIGPPASVRLSALNTTASFGILAFSRIPVVAALGVTVALIVMLALVMVELDLFRRHHEDAIESRA
jgi:predicted exporter